MGVAGAGKSVQGKLLAEKLGYEWVSTGELLRSSLNKEHRQEMLEGKLLDDQEIIDVIRQFFSDVSPGQECILDGFPRTLVQANWLLEQHFNIQAVVHLKVPKDIVKERLLKRGRPDDNEESIDMRFKEYEKHTLPIIGRFKQRNLPVFEIGGEGDIGQVHEQILRNVKMKADT